MLQPILPQLKTLRVVLASSSPRRQELIKNIASISKPLLHYHIRFTNFNKIPTNRA